MRNQITKAFAIPFVPKLVMGSSLLDRIELPDYSETVPLPGGDADGENWRLKGD